MSATASIAQEFYKLRQEWARVDQLKNWRLAIWVAQFQDVDIIDKFMETERLPVGVFNDIFFRFDTVCKSDPVSFEQALWDEYAAWFIPPPDERYDMLQALRNDGLLDPLFQPDIQRGSGFEQLLKEMLRFKAAIKETEKINFCLYFLPTSPETHHIGEWLQAKLEQGIPRGIRIITIDFAAGRKVDIRGRDLQPLVVEITPQLNMQEAINNEMDKGGGSSNTVGAEERYRRQVRVVMNTTPKNDAALTAKEVQTLLSLAKQVGSVSSIISSLLIASQAHYMIKDNAQSERYADEAIKRSEVAMQQNDPAGYPVWKSCILLKAALLAGRKKWNDAIVIYDRLAETATTRGDAFFIMEGHRLSGQYHYQQGRTQQAFEKLLLALVGGSYLEKQVIRQSTFLHAAYLAMHIGRQLKDKEELNLLEAELEGWIGPDWKELLEEGNMEQSTVKQKKGISVSLD